MMSVTIMIFNVELFNDFEIGKIIFQNELKIFKF